MTEIPAVPAEPAEPVAPPARSRRRLVIAIVVGAVVAVAAVVGVLVAVNAVNADAVVLYTSKAEQYSVVAPGEPTQEKKDLVGAITTTATYWTAADRYYSVSSTDGNDLPPSFRGQFLTSVLTAALEDAPGVSASSLKSDAVADAFLAEPEQITVSGNPAILTTVTLEGAPSPFNVVFTGREGILYMVVFSDSADTDDDDAFLESFTYLE